MTWLAVMLATLMLLATPQGILAQSAAQVHRIGVLAFADKDPLGGPTVRSLWQGLSEFGYVKGRDLELIVRSAQGRTERIPDLVAELLGQKIDVLFVTSTPGTLAAKKATKTVPIVFAGVLDPIGSGIVPSLARPGGNITGVTVGVGGEGFTGKCLELLREVAPNLSHLAVLVNPSYPLSMQFRKEVQAAGDNLNIKVYVREAANANELDRALAAIGASRMHGLFVAPDPFLTASSARIARFAAESRLPSLHFSRRFAEAGGLMSYGATLEHSYRRAAAHVAKILMGAKPADLPVEQPTHFELVINLKTAKGVGLEVPEPLLLRADETID